MLVVHHLNDSRSQRILWLLEELGVPYEIKNYARDATTRLAPPALKAVHPLGKSPVITDGDRTIAESGAIVDYIVRRHGKGQRAARSRVGALRRVRPLAALRRGLGDVAADAAALRDLARRRRRPGAAEAAHRRRARAPPRLPRAERSAAASSSPATRSPAPTCRSRSSPRWRSSSASSPSART